MRLIQGEHIDGVDRLIVAIYIQMMITRVPHARAVFRRMAPQITEPMVTESKSDPAMIPPAWTKRSSSNCWTTGSATLSTGTALTL